MKSPLPWLKRRLSGRADSEHAQNLIRIIITTLFISYATASALPIRIGIESSEVSGRPECAQPFFK